MKIKNRKKFIASVSILVMILLLIILSTNQALSHGEYKTKTICISYGDTLWTIASNEQAYNQYYENKTIKQIIEDIKNINSLEDNLIYVGQKIQIPLF